jgi:plasmid replication initiation protein
MADGELHRYRKTPPETDEDWQRLHRSLDRADRAWIVTGPMSAFAEHRKAWATAIGITTFLMLRKGELPALMEFISRLVK